jgi:hypothetical protein
VFEKATKTESDRRIALDPHTIELLIEHRDCVAAPDCTPCGTRRPSCSPRASACAPSPAGSVTAAARPR